jgi:hypothetical protein
VQKGEAVTRHDLEDVAAPKLVTETIANVKRLNYAFVVRGQSTQSVYSSLDRPGHQIGITGNQR